MRRIVLLLVSMSIVLVSCTKEKQEVVNETEVSQSFAKPNGWGICSRWYPGINCDGDEVCCGEPANCFCPIIIYVNKHYENLRDAIIKQNDSKVAEIFSSGEYLNVEGLRNMPKELVDEIIAGHLVIRYEAKNNSVIWKFINKTSGNVYRVVQIYERATG